MVYVSLDANTKRSYPRAMVQLARWLRRQRVDILQTHLFDAGLIGVLAARLAQTPKVIVTRHHTDQVEMTGTWIHRALDRWMAKQGDRVVAVSHAVRDYMVTHDHCHGDDIEVIHLGFDFAALSPTEEDRQRLRAEFGFSSEFVIGCVASFIPSKGHRYLLQALRELISVMPAIRLLLVGDGDRSEVETLITHLSLQDYVVFAGYRRDTPACMRAVDVMVHPSLSEAFCQVLIGAMGVGTALVTTDVGGAAEVVEPGETSMLIPVANTSAIVRAVSELYQNAALRQHMAAAGQNRVRQRFTVDKMVVQQIECYKRLLAHRE